MDKLETNWQNSAQVWHFVF